MNLVLVKSHDREALYFGDDLFYEDYEISPWDIERAYRTYPGQIKDFTIWHADPNSTIRGFPKALVDVKFSRHL